MSTRRHGPRSARLLGLLVAAACFGTSPAEGASPFRPEPQVILEEADEPGHFAWSLSRAGDVNGDGYDDVVVGTRGTADASVPAKMSLYLGGSAGLRPAPVWTVRQEDFLGLFVGPAGDVNADGYDDLLVADRSAANAGPGRVRLYLGARWGLSAEPAWTHDAGPQGPWPWRIQAAETAGDFDGDGYDDVLVGQQGLVLLFLGGAGGLGASPVVVWSNPYLSFGASVAKADVNGDGFDDVVVGSSWSKSVFLFLGGPAPRAEPDQVLGFWSSRRVFGAVQAAGDVDGDGYDDVLVAGQHDFDLPGGSGRVVLVRGSADGLDGEVAWETTTEYDTSLAGAGDLDGDGYDDVAVGDPYFHTAAPPDGRFLVFRGVPAGLPVNPDYERVGNRSSLGWNVAPAGDVDGDGHPDLLVSAPNAVPARFFVYFGHCPDRDADGACDDADPCPDVFEDHPWDRDRDGLGDACDPCPDDPGNDPDGDGVCASVDVCPTVADPAQADADGDHLGDACDPCPGEWGEVCQAPPEVQAWRGGCACDAGAGSGSRLAGLLLLALATSRRRRRGRPRAPRDAP